MRSPSRGSVTVGLAAAVLVGGAVAAVALPRPGLEVPRALGVEGTTASAAFPLGPGAPVRQVRYADRDRLVYRLVLRNDGAMPVTVTGVEDGVPDRAHPLLRVVGLAGGDVRVGGHEQRELRVVVVMTNCEFVSPRSGTVVSSLRLHVRRLGVLPASVTVPLPERLRTGSPRDEHCPHSGHDTRSPG